MVDQVPGYWFWLRLLGGHWECVIPDAELLVACPDLHDLLFSSCFELPLENA